MSTFRQVKIGFKNWGTREAPAIALTFNGQSFGDSTKHRTWQAARAEAQRYFDREIGDIMSEYTLDASSLCEVM